jgi:hypothetical protein
MGNRNIVWAVFGARERINEVQEEFGISHFDVICAELAGPRNPDDIVVVDSSFPYRVILAEYEKRGIPFYVISLDPECNIPFSMCRSIYVHTV